MGIIILTATKSIQRLIGTIYFRLCIYYNRQHITVFEPGLSGRGSSEPIRTYVGDYRSIQGGQSTVLWKLYTCWVLQNNIKIFLVFGILYRTFNQCHFWFHTREMWILRKLYRWKNSNQNSTPLCLAKYLISTWSQLWRTSNLICS